MSFFLRMEFRLFSKPHITHAQHTLTALLRNHTIIRKINHYQSISDVSSFAWLNEDLSETTFYFIRLDFSFEPQPHQHQHQKHFQRTSEMYYCEMSHIH